MRDTVGLAGMTCWECDAAAVRVTTVTLILPNGRAVSLARCDDCCWLYWLPLIAEGGTARDTAPSECQSMA